MPVDTISGMMQPAGPQSQTAWDRLIEASDPIEPSAVEVMEYRDTGAAFAVAAAHAAAFRAVGVGYAFRPKSREALPFGLFVASHDAGQARQLLERIGLGVDVVQPA